MTTESAIQKCNRLKEKYIENNRWIISFTLVVFYFMIFSAIQPDIFLNPYNLKSLLLEYAIPAFVAIGMSIQLICGEIDLSVASNIVFSNIFCGVMIMRGFPIWSAIILTLVTSIFLGLCLGIIVARVKVNSFIASLGLGQIYYSLGLLLYSYGSNRNHFLIPNIDLLHLPSSFKAIGQTELLGIQIPVYYVLVVILLFTVIFSKTKYFHYYYFIGANKEAASLSGIPVERMKMEAFIISATMASIAGIVSAARMGVSSVTFGTNMELKAIAACVIGGVSMKGGKGTIIGAALGALFLICISNGLRLANVPSNFYRIVEGFILLIAVIADAHIAKCNS